jgi:hypothetical protein
MPDGINIKVESAFIELSYDVADELIDELNKIQIDFDKYVSKQQLQLAPEAFKSMLNGQSSIPQTLIDSFINRISSVFSGAVNYAETIGELLAKIPGKDNEILVWQNVGIKNCPDCQGREGKEATREEWLQIGFPKSGWSICGHNCNCVLVGKGSTENTFTKRVSNKIMEL